MSSLVISLELDESESLVAQKFQLSTSKPKEEAKALEELFRAIASGAIRSNLQVYTGSADPVAASGTFTLVSAIATDAITIGTVTLTASSTPGTDEWEIDGASDTLDAAALAAAINAHSTLSKIVTATSSSNVVTVTANAKGPIGNQIPISSADATITASGTHLANGAGAVEDAGVSYSLGLS